MRAVVGPGTRAPAVTLGAPEVEGRSAVPPEVGVEIGGIPMSGLRVRLCGALLAAGLLVGPAHGAGRPSAPEGGGAAPPSTCPDPGALFRAMFRNAWELRASLFEALPLGRGDIVMAGDSITHGGEWAEIFPDLPVKNRGIGGDTSAGVLERLDPLVAGRPAKFVLLIGTNDLGQDVPVEVVAGNVSRILARFRVESPGTRLYLQSVLPRSPRYHPRIVALNARLRAVARLRGATWVDLHPHFVEADHGLRDEWTNDHLHLNGAGYLVWRDLLRPFLEE